MRNLVCLIWKHQWRFSYNYGVPLGCDWELWDKLKSESSPVYRCARCGKEKL